MNIASHEATAWFYCPNNSYELHEHDEYDSFHLSHNFLSTFWIALIEPKSEILKRFPQDSLYGKLSSSIPYFESIHL